MNEADSSLQPSRNNLVVLSFSNTGGSRYVKLNPLNKVKSDKLNVRPEENAWSYGSWKGMKIGERRPCLESGQGIIGVYDRTNPTHLDSMGNLTAEIMRAGSLA